MPYVESTLENLIKMYPDLLKLQIPIGVADDGRGTPLAPEQPVISLSAKPGESFDQRVERYATEKGCSLRQAIHDVGLALPHLAEAR
jgi:hypothetical protein